MASKQRDKVTLKKLTLHKLDWLEYLTIGLCIWYVIFPKPYEILTAVLIAIPILGLILNGLHKPSLASLVEVGVDKDGNDKYDVADFIDIAAYALVFRVFKDYEFESVYSMIIPGTIACVLIIGVLFLTHKKIEESTRSKNWIYASILFNITLYSYAATYAANCTFDYKEPTVYNSEVLDMNVTVTRTRRGGGIKTYYVKVAPWGHHYDTERISVSAEQYGELNIGDEIKIDLKQGLFGIPWYFIERKKYHDY